MTYRKIIVDGTEYEYSVGKTHTKVKNIGVFKNEEIGNTITREIDPACECCGEPMSTIYPSQYPIKRNEFAVRPKDIEQTIRNHQK